MKKIIQKVLVIGLGFLFCTSMSFAGNSSEKHEMMAKQISQIFGWGGG